MSPISLSLSILSSLCVAFTIPFSASVSSTCLGSTNKWDHAVPVFLCVAYFSYCYILCAYPHYHREQDFLLLTSEPHSTIWFHDMICIHSIHPLVIPRDIYFCISGSMNNAFALHTTAEAHWNLAGVKQQLLIFTVSIKSHLFNSLSQNMHGLIKSGTTL